MNNFAQRFLQNILNKKGYGLLFLLLPTLILILSTIFSLQRTFNVATPVIADVLYDIAPIRIQNGRVVDPFDTIREHIIYQTSDGQKLPFVIDTTVDTRSTFDYQTALYLTRTAFYAVSPTQIQTVPLSGSFSLNKRDYTADLDKLFAWSVSVLGFIYFPFIWIGFIIFNLAASLLLKLAEKIYGIPLNMGIRMRLNAYLLTFVLLIAITTEACGLWLSPLSLILILFILQLLLLRRLASIA